MKIKSQGTGLHLTGWICSIVTITVFLSVMNCAPDISGGGSEAGNARISGMVTDEEGKPASNVIVSITPADYDPVKDPKPAAPFYDTTGADGKYHFTIADSGKYSIFACQESSHTSTLLSYFAGKGDVTIPSCKLHKPGAVKVPLPQGSDTVNGYLYIPGTTIYAFLQHAVTSVIIDSVPSGIIPAIMYAAIGNNNAVEIRNNVNVIPGDTIPIVLPRWKYSRQLILNTSVTGADVQEDIYNFPVLVRLSSLNFDFSQAKTAGDDIRFTKADGTPLPHETEAWDGTGYSASIWVKIDTVFQNNEMQSIIMHWGNPDAENISESALVFDTTDGFQGVWHLNEMSGDTVRDATRNGYHGITTADSTFPSITSGAIGGCCTFDGVNDFITMPNTAVGRLNFAQDGKFSVSVWVKADTLIDLQQTLVSKDKYQYFLWIDSTTWQFWEFQHHTGWIASEYPAQSKQWILLTGVCDGTTQQLYVNGVPTSTHTLKADNSARDTSSDLILGRAHKPAPLIVEKAGIRSFKGSLDEVRISSTVHSAAWVRLCYMNQRSDDRLVIFK